MYNNVSTIAWALIKLQVSTKSVKHKIIAECYDPQDNRVSWRLSSDILNIKLVDGKYLVNTKMGCVYVCDKNAEDITKMISDSLKVLEESFDVEVIQMYDYFKV